MLILKLNFTISLNLKSLIKRRRENITYNKDNNKILKLISL